MSDIQDSLPDEPHLDAERSRRNLLGKGAIAAAAATVVGITSSKSAHATDNGNIQIGNEAQTAQSPTSLTTNGFSGKHVLLIDDDNFSPVDSSSHPGAIAGWSSARVGVYGYTDGLAQGVLGISMAGAGVEGQGAAVDIKAAGSGIIYMATPGVTTTPFGGAAGMLARDSTGALWYCYSAGVWRRLAGATTAGSFNPINPVRVYDSRATQPTPGILAPNFSRVISVKDGRDANGAVTAADVVPAGATAVSFNVTATGTTGSNYLSVVPGDVVSVSTSNVNWVGAGVSIANGGIVKLDASRQVKVLVGNQTGSTHVIIDISGFYL